MSEQPITDEKNDNLSHGETQSALFLQLVVQQSSMAMMMMGKTPNPQTGQTMRDLDAAQFFIDQLEMLEVKTRGNLSKAEEAMLKQTLMMLRMAFVEATEQPQSESKSTETNQTASATTATESGEESKKRFSKKFS